MKTCPTCKKTMDGQAVKPAQRGPHCTRCVSNILMSAAVLKMGDLATDLPRLNAVSDKQRDYGNYCRLRMLAVLNAVLLRTIAGTDHDRYLRIRAAVSRVVNRYDNSQFWIAAWKNGSDIIGLPYVDKPQLRVWHNGRMLPLVDVIKEECESRNLVTA